jgi:TorA maturation chaperone TorD
MNERLSPPASDPSLSAGLPSAGLQPGCWQEEEAILAWGRAALYNFLAAVFLEPPDERWADSLRDGGLAEVLALVATADEAKALIDRMACGDAGGWREELARAYTRHLVVPGPDYVPPYGSVYRDGPNGPPGTWQGRPTLWGPSSVAVAQAYREAGLALAPGGPQVPDHIGLELQFMQHLCACEAGALSRGESDAAAAWRARQAAFLRHHLLPWAPAFCARLDSEGIHLFYRLIARLIRAFLESEREETEL